MQMTPVQQIQGSNAGRSRSANRQAVLGQIQTAGQMGRAEIARALGLSTQAVSNIIAELEQDGLLREAGTRSRGRGLPAVQYGVNAQGGYAMGVEIRPDAIFAALVDLRGQAVTSQRQALKDTAPAKLVQKVQAVLAEMLTKSGVEADRLLGAGVVMPGPFGQTGVSGLGSDLAGWQEIDARALFEEALGVPVEVSNDANAAAMSERIAHKLSTFAYLYFGAGLGLGLVSDGRLVMGAFGNAGEIGHVPIMTPGGLVPLEQRLSRVAVQNALAAQPPVDIAMLAKLYGSRDADLMSWLAEGTAALSQAMGLIENLFDPETVILGGAMPECILDHLIDHVALPERSVSNRADAAHPRLQRGTCGRMTATLGAASLILNRAFTPQAAAL